MKRLSIIVPMYNVEPYVERCLMSLEKQDIPEDEYEIICINDGSPDDSRDVVIRMQKEFNNIILIEQENSGVSVARNNGIEMAKGKYILMVDPDDYIEANVLKDKLDTLNNYNIDIGFTGFTILNQALKDEYYYDLCFEEKDVLNGIDYSYKYERGKSGIRDPHRSVAIFFKKNFLDSNNLRYIANVPYLEDGEFISRVKCLADRVIFLNEPFYMRTTRPGSATHSNLYHSEKARYGFLKAAFNLLDFKQNICISEEQKIFMNEHIVHFTILYIISHRIYDYLKQHSNLHKNLKRGPLRKLETEGCSSHYKHMANCYNFSIHCFYVYWFFFRIYRSLKIRLGRYAKQD